MRLFAAVVVTALVATALAAPSARTTPTRSTTRSESGARYARAVTRICAGALLFDHAHDMGTRADALAVARDIRASTARRLARVIAVPVPSQLRRLSGRWIASQRRLAASFAKTWVQ